jgi:hypothetical protein
MLHKASTAESINALESQDSAKLIYESSTGVDVFSTEIQKASRLTSAHKSYV